MLLSTRGFSCCHSGSSIPSMKMDYTIVIGTHTMQRVAQPSERRGFDDSGKTSPNRARRQRRATCRGGFTDVVDRQLGADEHDGHTLLVRGTPLHLAHQEFVILQQLMDNAGRVVTRRASQDNAWSVDRSDAQNCLEVHIRRLRTKIESDANRPTRIRTVRGVGYIFDLPQGDSGRHAAAGCGTAVPSLVSLEIMRRGKRRVTFGGFTPAIMWSSCSIRTVAKANARRNANSAAITDSTGGSRAVRRA